MVAHRVAFRRLPRHRDRETTKQRSGRPGGMQLRQAATVATQVQVVVGSLVGEELCSFGHSPDSTWREFVFALECALKEKFDDGHVLLHGTDVLSGCEHERGLLFLQAPTDREAVHLTLVKQQRPQIREAIAAIRETLAELQDSPDATNRVAKRISKAQLALQTLASEAR